MSGRKHPDLMLRYHAAMPDWAKVSMLKIRKVPDCEGSGFAINKEQAERLALCWNVCADMPTEALQRGALARALGYASDYASGAVPTDEARRHLLTALAELRAAGHEGDGR